MAVRLVSRRGYGAVLPPEAIMRAPNLTHNVSVNVLELLAMVVAAYLYVRDSGSAARVDQPAVRGGSVSMRGDGVSATTTWVN